MYIKIILNPYANRWGAREQTPTIETACRSHDLDYSLEITQAPEDGIRLARMAAEDPAVDAVVAAGGDGTINEVINGVLLAAGSEPTKPFGIIPVGTANDFARMAGLPLGIDESVAVIAAGQTRQIDGGRVNERFFINNSAAAMEPMVTIENIRMKRLSGEIRYVAALVRALVRLKPWQMQITWDDGEYDGPAYLLSVCNSPRTGGFMMAPGAEIDDGQFDMVFAPQAPKTTVLSVLAGLMRGTHINHPAVTFCRTTGITVHSRPGTPLHADGEVFTESAEFVNYQILPGQVTLLSPRHPLPEPD
ncbi:MAG: diacylglycerol kinase family lipid kinase [Chloroflexota bacterium]